MIYHLGKRVGPAPDIARGAWSVLTDDVLGRAGLMMNRLCCQIWRIILLKDLKEVKRWGLKLARTNSTEAFWRTAIFIWGRQPAWPFNHIQLSGAEGKPARRDSVLERSGQEVRFSCRERAMGR